MRRTPKGSRLWESGVTVGETTLIMDWEVVGMDEQNTDDVEEVLLRLRRERVALIDEAMKKDGELALMGKNNITKTDAERRRRTVAEKKEIERKAMAVREEIRRVEEGRITASRQRKLECAALEEDDATKDEVVDGEADAPVTDHAVVRWLERKHKLDVAAMRRDIYEEAMSSGGVIYKNGRFYNVVKDGYVYVVDGRDKTVVTCYEKKTETIN